MSLKKSLSCCVIYSMLLQHEILSWSRVQFIDRGFFLNVFPGSDFHHVGVVTAAYMYIMHFGVKGMHSTLIYPAPPLHSGISTAAPLTADQFQCPLIRVTECQEVLAWCARWLFPCVQSGNLYCLWSRWARTGPKVSWGPAPPFSHLPLKGVCLTLGLNIQLRILEITDTLKPPVVHGRGLWRVGRGFILGRKVSDDLPTRCCDDKSSNLVTVS